MRTLSHRPTPDDAHHGRNAPDEIVDRLIDGGDKLDHMSFPNLSLYFIPCGKYFYCNGFKRGCQTGKGTSGRAQRGGEGSSRKRPSPSRFRRATLPKGRGFGRGEKFTAYRLTSSLPLTGEDETYPLCQGLAPSGELSSAARLRGFVESQPSPARLRRATLPKGRGLARAESLPLIG